jgi:predicted DNA-binding transcriptional regulator YafY
MRRADRLFEIVQLLRRARRPVSASAIAAELESSKRAIYRDIAALKARRVPITGEPGIGYVLESGFDMPPLMLAPDEVEAAVLGAQWVASRGEPELARAALNLLAKIEAVVPVGLRPHILEPATSVAPPKEPTSELEISAGLRRAIRSGNKVQLIYRDRDGAPTERVVWPVLLGYRDAGRILAAWCELRAAFRYFRTDRMDRAMVLEVRFPDRPARLRAKWRSAMDIERRRWMSGASDPDPVTATGEIAPGGNLGSQ